MSTTTNHTSGPWSAYIPNEQRPLTARGNPSDKRIMVLHPDSQRIIACLSTGYVNKEGPIPDQERICNARLIAAAPELLEALKAAEPWIPARSGPVQQQVADAIAKATISTKES